jgi:hypothetical protein
LVDIGRYRLSVPAHRCRSLLPLLKTANFVAGVFRLFVKERALSLETNAAPKRRRTELPQLPLKQHNYIFGPDITKLAAQEGRRAPGKGTIQKLLSRAGREAGRGPKIAGWLGKRPVYAPADVIVWLDSLVTETPQAIGITASGSVAAE